MLSDIETNEPVLEPTDNHDATKDVIESLETETNAVTESAEIGTSSTTAENEDNIDEKTKAVDILGTILEASDSENNLLVDAAVLGASNENKNKDSKDTNEKEVLDSEIMKEQAADQIKEQAADEIKEQASDQMKEQSVDASDSETVISTVDSTASPVVSQRAGQVIDLSDSTPQIIADTVTNVPSTDYLDSCVCFMEFFVAMLNIGTCCCCTVDDCCCCCAPDSDKLIQYVMKTYNYSEKDIRKVKLAVKLTKVTLRVTKWSTCTCCVPTGM